MVKEETAGMLATPMFVTFVTLRARNASQSPDGTSSSGLSWVKFMLSWITCKLRNLTDSGWLNDAGSGLGILSLAYSRTACHVYRFHPSPLSLAEEWPGR